jgi:Uncharacterized conserved protein
MNSLGIDQIKQGKVTIDVSDIPSGVAVAIVGDIDMQDPSVVLDPLFDKVHKGAMDKGLKVVNFDLRQLAFLNSSGIKAIAKWIMSLAVAPADKKYLIKIQQNKSIPWQTTSLPTLTFLVPGAVQIE